MEDTPAKICGGRVREIGGRDHVLMRGAGVESVLQTVRMEVITQLGASGMIVEPERPFARNLGIFWGRGDGEGLSLSVCERARLRGVDFVGVFCWWCCCCCCSPRGVAVAAVFDGVLCVPFLGVDGADPARDGVPGAEALAREIPVDRDRSRKA